MRPLFLQRRFLKKPLCNFIMGFCLRLLKKISYSKKSLNSSLMRKDMSMMRPKYYLKAVIYYNILL